MLSIPGGLLLMGLLLLSSIGVLAWLFPTETTDTDQKNL